MNIEDYALIGDCETAALVGRNGSIDWLCWPDFSSPACFASLLGTRTNGRWLLAPKPPIKRVMRRYRDHTLILETKFETASGILLLTDFMPVRERYSDIVRTVRCVEGRVECQMELRLRFDYGRTVPWTGLYEGNSWAAFAGPNVVYLRTHQPIRTEESVAYSNFVLRRNEQRSFVLTHSRSDEAPPRRINARKAFAQTEKFWIQWCAINTSGGPWKDVIERSLITLKALTFRPTGGIVAAATTSLPEQMGGSRNWDYRYCWLRDAVFTLESLLSAGYREEAKDWQRWLLQAVASNVGDMQIVYGVRGERHLPECELPWLRGYRHSAPVRIGNGASEQLQLDVYGEVADALARMERAHVRLDVRMKPLREGLTSCAAALRDRRAFGIWEQRDHQSEFVYSQVMVWLALDHGIRAAEAGDIRGDVPAWTRMRDRLHRRICRLGFNRKLGSFVQSFGSAKLDAAALLIPLFGFLPFTDERVRSTVLAIEKRLGRDGLVYRYRPESSQDFESPFLACSFWLVQNLAGTGRRRDAERLYERLLSLTNDVGLLPEEYDPVRRTFMGNFPQAFSHTALINAGRMLSQ